MFKQGQQFIGNKTQLVAPQKIEYTIKKLKSISICIPDSIIDKCQSSELRSYFISQLARTCSQFQVDEIIILKDHSYKTMSLKFDATGYVARNLQYIETPQYLRKALFGIHPDLKYTGLMNPIECKHHLKADEWCQYREGVVLNRPARKGDESSWVDIGLYMKQCKVSISLQAGTRVTVKLDQEGFDITEKYFTGTVVSSSTPKEDANLYWGYQVRIANGIKEIFDQSIFGEGYDLTMLFDHKQLPFSKKSLASRLNFDQRVLIVFGGFDGLDSIVDGDERSKVTSSQF